MIEIVQDSIMSWLVCMGAFLALAGTVGIDTSFGIAIETIIKELQISTYKVSWIQSIHSSSMFLFAFVSSFLMNKYGLRMIILIGTIISCTSYFLCGIFKNYVLIVTLYGIAGGAGSGLLYAAGNIACFQYFKTYETIASGIAMSGTGFGMIAVSLSCSYTVINFGYFGYFIALALISSMSFLFAFSTFPLAKNYHVMEEEELDGFKNKSSLNGIKSYPSSNGYIKEESIAMINKEKSSDSQTNRTKKLMVLIRDKRLLGYCLVQIFFELAYYVPVDFLPEMMLSDGISQLNADTTIAFIGFFILISKLILALILRYTNTNPVIISSISMFFLGFCCIAYTICSTYKFYVVVTIAYGMVISSVDMLIPFIILEFFDADNLDDGFGLIMLTKAFIPLWGSPVAGALYDWTGSYDMAFYTAGCLLFIGSLTNLLVYWLQLKKLRKDVNREND